MACFSFFFFVLLLLSSSSHYSGIMPRIRPLFLPTVDNGVTTLTTTTAKPWRMCRTQSQSKNWYCVGFCRPNWCGEQALLVETMPLSSHFFSIHPTILLGDIIPPFSNVTNDALRSHSFKVIFIKPTPMLNCPSLYSPAPVGGEKDRKYIGILVRLYKANEEESCLIVGEMRLLF